MRAWFKIHDEHRLGLRRLAAAGVLAVALATPVCSAPEDEPAPVDAKISIEDLLKSGWQVAGYTSTVDNRSTFILFRHPAESYLVQCRAGYDVTRTPREHTNCYELR